MTPSVDALVAIAREARAADRQLEARQALETAIAQAPWRADLWVMLGEVLWTIGLQREAAAAGREALARDPDAPGVLNFTGLIESRLGDVAAAEATYRKLLARHPHYSPGAANLAILLEHNNRLDDADAVARAGLRVAPNEPLLNLVAAKCALRRGDHETCALHIDRIEAKAGASLVAQHAAYLRGKLHDARGEPALAYAAFQRANERARASWLRVHRGPNTHRLVLAEERRRFTPAWLASWDELPPPAPLPFRPTFLVGFPRSGTTLLDQILDGHEQVMTLEERTFAEDLMNEVAALPDGYPGALADLDPGLRDRLRARYAAAVAADKGELKPVVVDKFPLKMTKAGFIQRVFPEARFILALRHPYDVVLSGFMQEFLVNEAMASFFSLDEAAEMYDECFSLWQQYRDALPLAVHEVRYEALIEDLEAEVRPTLEFVGVGWDARVAGFAEHARSRGRIRTPSYSQVSQGLYTSARGRFTKYLQFFSPRARALLDPWVARLGYAPVAASVPPTGGE